MDWPTTIGVSVLVVATGLTTFMLVRWGISQSDSATLAKDAQREQAAQMHEAERQRDAAIVTGTKAQGELALALADNAKLHDAITGLIKASQTQIKETINAATGDDLLAAARAVLGVPQLPHVPPAGGTGAPAAGGGAAPTAAVRVPTGA